MKKLPYSEGTVFLVPLKNGGYARGVIARSGPKGGTLYGYFFGPKIDDPLKADFSGISPGQSIIQLRFGDLGLYKGKWPILGMLPDWQRSKWPMPNFMMGNEYLQKFWLVRYSDTDPSKEEFSEQTQYDPKIPKDRLAGAGAVEITLGNILNREKLPSETLH